MSGILVRFRQQNKHFKQLLLNELTKGHSALGLLERRELWKPLHARSGQASAPRRRFPRRCARAPLGGKLRQGEQVNPLPPAATFARGQRGPCPRLLSPREPALGATWLCCGWGSSWDCGGAVWRPSRAESWAADRLPLVPKARITSAEKAAAAFGSISGERASAAGSAAPPAGARRGGGGGRPLPGGRLREGGTGLRPGPVEHLPGPARRPRTV